MKLTIKNKINDWQFFGYGNTLLECIYDLSSEKIKEGIFLELSESYAEDERFYNDDEFLEDAYNDYISNLPNSYINNIIYSWCERNNQIHQIEED